LSSGSFPCSSQVRSSDTVFGATVDQWLIQLGICIGVVHLLKAVTAIRLREAEGEEDVDQVNPLNHLAKYLLRHNPRFGEPVSWSLLHWTLEASLP
jgi:hypothetical protein